MSHLCGTASAKAFLDSGGKTIVKDGNNKPITDYLQLNNFQIEPDSLLSNIYIKKLVGLNDFNR